MVNKEMKFLDNGDIRYEIVDEAARSNIQTINTVLDTKADISNVTALDTRVTGVEDDCYNSYAVDTASGAVASFSDGADDIPLKSLVVNIDTVQDLHGQDAPYPAGGGKNKLLFSDKNRTGTSYGVTCTFDRATETFTVTGTETRGSAFSVLINFDLADLHTPNFVAGETYTVSIVPTGGSNNNYVYCQISYRTTSATTSALFMARSKNTFTVPSNFDCVYNIFIGIYAGATDLNYSFKVQIESGSTATSWSPYENICPISGWTGMTVSRTGINQWDEEWEVGGYAGSTGAAWDTNTRIRSKTTNYISVLPNTTYYVNMPSGTSMYLDIMFYNADKTFISSTNPNAGTTFTTPSDARFMRFASSVAYGTTYNHDISINYPSTDHSYHPYTGRSTTIDLGQTVYGGKLDVLSGVLTVDRAMATLDGSSDENWSLQSINSYGIVNFSTSIPHYPERNYKSACNMLAPQVSAIVDASTEGYYVHQNGATVFIRISVDRASTVDEWRAWLAQNNIQLVYSLAEPIEIQLSPNQINSLLGQNNIFADTGDCAVEYRADTKMYIERLTEPDADMIADANIVSGQYFMVGNSLYLATSNIASGGQVIVGTNCTKKSLATALNEINQ